MSTACRSGWRLLSSSGAERTVSNAIPGSRYATPSRQWSARSRAVTVVFPAPSGPAMASRAGFTARVTRPGALPHQTAPAPRLGAECRRAPRRMRELGQVIKAWDKPGASSPRSVRPAIGGRGTKLGIVRGRGYEEAEGAKWTNHAVWRGGRRWRRFPPMILPHPAVVSRPLVGRSRSRRWPHR